MLAGFFQSLALKVENNLQDALSLLTIWFRYGAQPEVTTAVIHGTKQVTCTLWLDVVPQVYFRCYYCINMF